jgi:hypothetical protein
MAMVIGGCQTQPVALPAASPTLQAPALVSYDDSSTVPWVLVANRGVGPVEIRLWDGSAPYVSQCGTKQTFPKGADRVAVPPPPWRLTVRDVTKGLLVAERVITGREPGQFIFIEPDRVSIGHLTGVPSGPVMSCSPGPRSA